MKDWVRLLAIYDETDLLLIEPLIKSKNIRLLFLPELDLLASSFTLSYNPKKALVHKEDYQRAKQIFVSAGFAKCFD